MRHGSRPALTSRLTLTTRVSVRRSPDQREALLLVGAEGTSYEAAARVTGVALGTGKSRVNRARSKLAELLDLDSDADIGPDGVTKAALAVE
jgi:RNA polymerase sigma-70 factor (ECF subfamily)